MANLRRSALAVLGGVLVTPDETDRRRRAAWIGRLDAACWRTPDLRALADAIGSGATDVRAVVQHLRADCPGQDALGLVSDAIDTGHRETDRLRQHAAVVLAAGQAERASWALDAALHRLMRLED